MKLVSKISLNKDEEEVLNAFVTLLETICFNCTDCSDCPICRACKYQGNLPKVLDLLLSKISMENT